MTDIATVQLLNEIAANAIPPLVSQRLGGWTLRYAPDRRLRTCSVFVPPGGDGMGLAAVELAQRIDLAEEFYARRQAPARFQLSSLGNETLDAALAERGYALEAPVTILVADASEVAVALRGRSGSASGGDSALGSRPGAERSSGPGAEVTVTEHITPAWRNLYKAVAGGERSADRIATFERVGPRIAFATAAVPAQGAAPARGAVPAQAAGGAGAAGRADRAARDPASLGLSVAERGWAGFFTIETSESARGAGLATAVMAGLTEWAIAAGATRCYLQVEAANGLAESWYRRLGYETAYRYHYRTRQWPEEAADMSC